MALTAWKYFAWKRKRKYQDVEYLHKISALSEYKRSVIITQAHTKFCSRFTICVTNMYFATDAISVMLGSVMSVLHSPGFFIISTPTHTSAVNTSEDHSESYFNADWKHLTLLWSLDCDTNCFWEVSCVSPRSLPDPLRCPFADLILCFYVTLSLSLLTLAFTHPLHHSLCLHWHPHTHCICLSFKHGRLF